MLPSDFDIFSSPTRSAPQCIQTIGERHTVRAFALGDLILVVRKDQIRATTVNIERLAQRCAGHCRTFDVPAWSSVTPRRRPRWLGRLGALPQHEVEWVTLTALDSDALSGTQVVERFARELSVPWEFAHGKVDVTAISAIVCLIRKILFPQHLDQLQHLRHVVGRARLLVGRRQPERREILVHVADESLGKLADGLAVFGGAPDDLVFHIGNVSNIGDVEAEHAHPALRHVHRHEQTRMPQMAVVVYRHAADVQADAAGHHRLQRLFAS